MNKIKSLLFIAIFSIGLNGFAGITYNGIMLNGMSLNGISLNGMHMNGMAMNGLRLNGSDSKVTSINLTKLADESLFK